jgi:hypothetical protein
MVRVNVCLKKTVSRVSGNFLERSAYSLSWFDVTPQPFAFGLGAF